MLDNNNFIKNLERNRIIRQYHSQYHLMLYKIARLALFIHYTSILEINDLIIVAINQTPEIIAKYDPKFGGTLLSYLFYSWRNIMLHELQKNNNKRNKFSLSLLENYNENIPKVEFSFEENFWEHVKRLCKRKIISQLAQQVIFEILTTNTSLQKIKRERRYSRDCINKIIQEVQIVIQYFN